MAYSPDSLETLHSRELLATKPVKSDDVTIIDINNSDSPNTTIENAPSVYHISDTPYQFEVFSTTAPEIKGSKADSDQKASITTTKSETTRHNEMATDEQTKRLTDGKIAHEYTTSSMVTQSDELTRSEDIDDSDKKRTDDRMRSSNYKDNRKVTKAETTTRGAY